MYFIKNNIIDEKIDPVYAEISSQIQNRNYQKGFQILANEYESRNIDRRMNLIVNKGTGLETLLTLIREFSGQSPSVISGKNPKHKTKITNDATLRSGFFLENHAR